MDGSTYTYHIIALCPRAQTPITVALSRQYTVKPSLSHPHESPTQTIVGHVPSSKGSALWTLQVKY